MHQAWNMCQAWKMLQELSKVFGTRGVNCRTVNRLGTYGTSILRLLDPSTSDNNDITDRLPFIICLSGRIRWGTA